MPRAKFQTLTEQMFYTLLCLKEECYGMDILDRVPALYDMCRQRMIYEQETLILRESLKEVRFQTYRLYHPEYGV